MSCRLLMLSPSSSSPSSFSESPKQSEQPRPVVPPPVLSIPAVAFLVMGALFLLLLVLLGVLLLQNRALRRGRRRTDRHRTRAVAAEASSVIKSTLLSHNGDIHLAPTSNTTCNQKHQHAVHREEMHVSVHQHPLWWVPCVQSAWICCDML